jgi:hypothetical protein
MEPNFFVTELWTNGISKPVVQGDAVFFSWQCRSSVRDFVQTAYQIVVLSSAENAVIWDSGKVESGRSAGIAYEGPSLAADAEYFWKVRIWKKSEVSPYSEPAAFYTGLRQEDWQASFIWEAEETENSFLYFRKEFALEEKPVARAVLYATAHNDYQLYVDGAFLGAGPARVNPFVYGQYNRYDVKALLKPGTVCTLAALTHWHGAWEQERENPIDKEPQRTWGDSGVNGRPAFLLELHITYGDGTKQVIVTDETWRVCADGPYIRENPIYFGDYGGKQNRASIRYDANRELSGWQKAGFDDSLWPEAVKQRSLGYRLYAQEVEDQQEMAHLTPDSVLFEEGVSTAAFDKCYTGWVKIRFPKAAKGEVITISYREVGGELESELGAGYDVYIASGSDDVFYTPFVRHTSFKFVKVSGYSQKLEREDITGIVAYSCAPRVGRFRCSEPLLNDIYEMCERSSRQNVQQGIISVDANREQSPWLADSWNIGIGLLYSSKTRLIDKVVRDYGYEQRASGQFYSCSPGAIYELQEWSYYWAMLLWQQYLFDGNLQLLREFYPHLCKFLEGYVPTGFEKHGLCSPEGWRASDYPNYENSGYMESGGTNIGINSMLFGNYQIAAEAAAVLGDDAGKERFTKRAEALRKNILAYLVKDGVFLDCLEKENTHPLASAWAVRFGVPTAEMEPRLREHFQNAWKRDQHFFVGGYGGCTLYEALYRLNLGDIARQDFQRYRHMLAANRTNWESFGALSRDNMGNHAWSAYPAYILPKFVGGISPAGGGFSAVEIRPVFEGLQWAETSVDTVKGTVQTDWKKKDGICFLNIKLPANSKGLVILPPAKNLTEGGGSAEEAPGVHAVRRLEGRTEIEIGSGEYAFSFSL